MDTVIRFPNARRESRPLAKIIEDICEKSEATIIITCHSRTHFLEQLVEYISQPETRPNEEPTSPSNPQAEATAETDDDYRPNSPPRVSPLLHPTLRLLSASSKIHLIFCPTIPVFRAYMSTLPVHITQYKSQPVKLVILDVLALHLGTSEFTVQGLSRSFSLIASFNHSFAGTVELMECGDPVEESNQQSQSLSWETEVPLLSGSIKIGDAGQGWANRTVTIEKFANRWFHFA